MRKIGSLIFICLILIFSGCSTGSGNSNKAGTKMPAGGEVADISFVEYEHDFGKVTEGEKVGCVFSFTNRGPGNLVISSASVSCGCTVTKYNKNPVAPGEGGTLEVVFDTSGRNGTQTKTVSVSSNSKTPVVILKITAEVIPNRK